MKAEKKKAVAPVAPKKAESKAPVAPVASGAGKGHKLAISADSFKKSTLHNKIRKGFIGVADIESTLLVESTKAKVADFIKAESKKGAVIDMLFVRDKNLCFLLDNKKKVVYNVADCRLKQYADYFISKNNNYKVQAVADMHPANLHSRGQAVQKVAESAGFTL